MPALDDKVINDLKARLCSYLKKQGDYGEPEYLNAGGSAAVFKVEFENFFRVFKVFDHELFSRASGEAERRRLDVQRRLIDHNCSSLVQTFRVEESEDTAFMEMEFIDWPQLTDQLASVPDEAIIPLITQLVSAVRFLEEQNIIHRDLKPENIHISPDFTKLKLLDLGVAREFEISQQDDASVSDHGNLRPFLATAQYSSPEYLFRLDEPTERLWHGLNFYQIGAVLHDLIMKKPIFQHEMELGNRWLVAKAVLTKSPSFTSLPQHHLSHLRALAARCLVKDLDTRLQLVGWDDFVLEGASNPLVSLQGRLAKKRLHIGADVGASTTSRLEFDRAEFVKRFIDNVRAELISICGTDLPLTMKPPTPDNLSLTGFMLAYGNNITIVCNVEVEWQTELYERSANIRLSGQLINLGSSDEPTPPIFHVICTATMLEGENESVICLSEAIAEAVERAIDHIEASSDATEAHGIDLQLDKVSENTE